MRQTDREVLQRLIAEAGPPRPDDLGVCYDPDTEEGQAALRAYQERRAEQFRQADEAWARKYPGVEFRRLSDRLKRHSSPPVNSEPEG